MKRMKMLRMIVVVVVILSQILIPLTVMAEREVNCDKAYQKCKADGYAAAIFGGLGGIGGGPLGMIGGGLVVYEAYMYYCAIGYDFCEKYVK